MAVDVFGNYIYTNGMNNKTSQIQFWYLNNKREHWRFYVAGGLLARNVEDGLN